MHRFLAICCTSLAVTALPLQATDAPASLPPVDVTATRLDGSSAFDAPASVTLIALDDGSERAGANIADAFAGVPGVLARDRQNAAQDTQLSIRGFGARATFGVRGLRLYADGIPATMPDGQGQITHFALFGAERIEILRGPFSALYGHSSGGVVQLYSADGGAPTAARVQTARGSYGVRHLAAGLSGGSDDAGINLSAAASDSDGYRRHSAAQRRWLNLKAHVALDSGGRIDLVANGFSAPDAQDPLGLSRRELRADARQATAVALQYDTRKSARQNQVGAVWRQPLTEAQSLRLMAYAGRREIEQFLAIPVSAQANPLSGGGVVDLAGDYGGGDLRWSWQGELAARPLELDLGVSADRQVQRRRGYENFIGAQLGLRGALRRDEDNRARNDDLYLQAWWQPAPRWSLLAGLRRTRVHLAADDFYRAGTNPDDSGKVDYAQTAPVAGITFAPASRWRVYAAYGRGFETPTLNELSYRADGGAGLAFDLRPVRSRNGETGLKWQRGEAAVEAALFRSDSRDELAVARNVGGRSSFRNAGRSRREGVELAASLPLAASWNLQLAYTRLDARFRDGFLQCSGAGCTTPSARVPAGTPIPGLARDQFGARLRWRGAVCSAAAEVTALSRVGVNDSGSEQAPAYALLNLEAGRDWLLQQGRLHGFARLDNVFDRRHVGSVIVNEGNGRYYEPGAQRSITLGLRWHWND